MAATAFPPPPKIFLALGLLFAQYFIMTPGMGSGVAGANTARPNLTRLKGLVGHSVFDIGMYVTALKLQADIPITHSTDFALLPFSERLPMGKTWDQQAFELRIFTVSAKTLDLRATGRRKFARKCWNGIQYLEESFLIVST